jgi:hypothetical protein
MWEGSKATTKILVRLHESAGARLTPSVMIKIRIVEHLRLGSSCQGDEAEF